MDESSPPVGGASPSDLVQAGQDALARHAWQEAFDRLTEADRVTALGGDDLEALAQAAFFTAQADIELEVRERAFTAHLEAGDELRAAYLALDIARRYFWAGRQSIGSAWMRRADRLLPPGGDSYAHGYQTLVRSEIASASGDIDGALKLAEQAVAIGDRAADADLRAYALSNLGSLKIATGATADGFALMEEASVSAINGELSPFTTGVTTCAMIATCRDLTDYRRASEWIEATQKYCSRHELSGFPGVCRIHRAEVTAVAGAWDQAEQELERATTELGDYRATGPQADGFYAIGEIRRLRGDFEGAEAALREAHSRGRSPQPALALIRLAQGKVKAASASIGAALGEETWDRLARSRLLPAQVEIAIAAGDVGAARAAVDELSGIVASYRAPALEATRQVALGRVLVAEGDAAGAVQELRAAVRGWREVGSPYEIARARAALSRALRALDDDEDADLELRAALAEFERLGARPEAAAATLELQAAADRRGAPTQVRMTFVFTDIVGSTRLAEALGDADWERLLRWHDDMLRGLVAAGGGEIVNSTGDGFFVAFASARRAVDCSISIQRALRDQRETSGFAIAVRIGIHAAEANRRATDYSGIGVHVAARVAALAGGGEILATTDALADAGVTAADAREVEVKGVSAPITVAAVPWS